MAPRDNFVDLLRSADRRLAEVAPSAALEARILARVRGETPVHEEAPLSRWFARARRPVLVLSVAMVLALITLDGRGRERGRGRDGGGGEVTRANPAAASPTSPDRGEPEAPPEIGPADPGERQACGEPGSGRPCDAPAKSAPIEQRVGPVATARPLEAPREILSPSLPRERGPAPLQRDHGPEAPPPSSPPASPVKPDGSPSGGAPGATPTAGSSYAPRQADEWANREPLAMRGAGPQGSPGEASDPASPGVQTIPSNPGAEAPHHVEEEPADGEPADGEPGEEPGACVTNQLGDGATCFDYGDIKTQTYELCDAQKLILTDLKFAGDCADGATKLVEYTCCPLPKPAQVTCIGLALGDGSTCQSPDALKQQGFDACAAEGLALTDLGLAGDCPDGGSSFAKVECCGDANDPGYPPPPPPDACIYDAFGDGTCQPASAWKQQASDYCAANALSLTEIYYSEECPNGDSGYVKFACCGP